MSSAPVSALGSATIAEPPSPTCASAGLGEFRAACGGGQAGDVEVVLNRERQARERERLPAREPLVHPPGGLKDSPW